MAYTDAQARALYDTLTPEQKAAVDAAGGPSVEWFTRAVGAGVPAAGRIAGGRGGPGEGEGDTGGSVVDPSGAADSSEWMGKRMPTAQEFRKWSQQQHQDYLGGNKNAQDEDYERYTDREIAAWLNEGWDAGAGRWKQGYNPTGPQSEMYGGSGGGGGGRGGYGVGGYGVGDVPQFNWTRFQAPTYESAMADPGYQFALKQGADTLQSSAMARGIGRTSGSLKDLINYGQDAAATQYQNVYNRDLASWGANFQGEQAAYAPQYGAWQTQFGAGENRWQTMYGGDLARYLNRENNIYGLLGSPPAPTY